MCGIVGIVNLISQAPVRDPVLTHMNERLNHRGPDDTGVFLDGEIGFAMKRLAINDVKNGQQPIFNEDKSLCVVCNGEIYSHPKIKKSLQRHGHTYRSNSDVESIVHAYEEYGENFLEFLNGMFAFAIWDKQKREVLLARDRAGVKPLYYTFFNQDLIFASELKALVSHPDIKPELDYLSLNQYLSFEYVPTPRTIYKNIFKLPAGHFLRFSSRGASTHEYWDLKFKRAESRPPLALPEVTDSLHEVLDNAVSTELLSDVPVGIFLSGGIDSSVLAAITQSKSPKPIKTFTLQFDDKSFDESQYAKIVADHIGSEHCVRRVENNEIVSQAESIPDIFDEPFGDSSIIPTFLLSKFASESVKTVLGGDGGDELFAGYPTLLAHRLVELYERFIPYGIRASLIPRLVNALPVSFNNLSFDFKAKRFLTGRGVPMGIRHHRWIGSFLESEKNSLFHNDYYYSDVDTYSIVGDYLKHSDANEFFNQLLYLDFKLYLEGDILAKVDRASMANSLEVRVPFLNSKVIEHASMLPFNYKLKGFQGKYLLKKVAKRLLPSSIVKRPKKGFNVPIGKLICGELKDFAHDHLHPDTIKRQGVFDHRFIDQLLQDHIERKADYRKTLWTLLMFQVWHAKQT